MNSSQQDFIRRMPEASNDLRRPLSVWRVLHIDPLLLLLLLLLTGLGLSVLYSASQNSAYIIKRQLVFFLLAYLGMFVVAHINMSFFRRWSLFFYVGGLALLVSVLLVGDSTKGAQRWLEIGGFRFQPSEMMKLAMPIAIAAFLAHRAHPMRFVHIFWALVLVFVPTVLIVQQPDLGTSILVATSGLLVIFYAGLPWGYIGGSMLMVLLSAWPMWHYVLHDYQKQRILTLFNPSEDSLGAGWNIMQSKTAIGSGGLSGKGWMQGTQSHLDFLPEGHTDFIIAVLAEERGFLGVLLVLLLYLLIVVRGFMIALYAQDTFQRLLAAALTLTFFVYVFVNAGMVSGLLPVVGVPLPLVSLGGTSLITLMLGFGLLMNISTEPGRVSNRVRR